MIYNDHFKTFWGCHDRGFQGAHTKKLLGVESEISKPAFIGLGIRLSKK
jgi:hypothetical protein